MGGGEGGLMKDLEAFLVMSTQVLEARVFPRCCLLFTMPRMGAWIQNGNYCN